MSIPSDHVNQRLANLIIHKQLPVWDKKELRMYKKMYLTSKALLFQKYDFSIPQPHRMFRYRSNWPAVTPVNLTILSLDRSFTLDATNALGSTTPIRQLTITPRPAQIGSISVICQELITLHLANAFSLTTSIRQLTITPRPAQIGSIPPPNWLQ